MAAAWAPLVCCTSCRPCSTASRLAVNRSTSKRIPQVGSRPTLPIRSTELAQQVCRRRLQRAGRKSHCATASAAAADSEEATAAVVEQFYVEHELPQGRLLIRPVQEADVGAASVLLTRAFATSSQGVHIMDGRKYCEESLSQPPRGVLLVARLFPTDSSLLRPGQESRLVATTGLSFTPDTREQFPTLQPPDGDAYLSNMAVDRTQRRQGYARRMLAAAEALAAACGFRWLYLHARLGDEPAQQLYHTSGYRLVEQDNVLLARMRSITPRALMAKQL